MEKKGRSRRRRRREGDGSEVNINGKYDEEWEVGGTLINNVAFLATFFIFYILYFVVVVVAVEFDYGEKKNTAPPTHGK